MASYDVPEKYVYEEYGHGKPTADEKTRQSYIVIFRDQDSGQLIVLTKVRDYPKIDVKSIRVLAEDFSRSYKQATTIPAPGVKLRLYIPFLHFLCVRDPAQMPEELTIKGFEKFTQETYAQGDHRVLYLRGDFKKLGLFRRPGWFKQYVSFVYEFDDKSQGGMAVLTHSGLEETLFAFSHPMPGQKYDEASFRSFVNSITFEKKIFDPDLNHPMLKSAANKVKTKISF